jgi:hypothetical protein
METSPSTTAAHKPKLYVLFSLGIAGRDAPYSIEEKSLLRMRRWAGLSPEGAPHAQQPSGRKYSVVPALLELLPELSDTYDLQFVLIPTQEIFELPNSQPSNGGKRTPFEIFLRDLPEGVKPPDDWERECRARIVNATMDPEETWRKIVHEVLDKVDSGDRVWVEPTNGFRSLQIALTMTTLLLRALRPDALLLGLTYAEFPPFGSPLDKPAVIYDMAPYFELGELAPPIAALGDRFDPHPLIRYLEGKEGAVDAPEALQNWRRNVLEPIHEAIDGGAPRDLLRHCWALRDSLAEAGTLASLPAPFSHYRELLRSSLKDLLRFVPNEGEVSPATGEYNSALQNETAIRFELDLVDYLIKAKRENEAIRLFRETMISAVILATERTSESEASGPYPPVDTASLQRRNRAADVLFHWKGEPWKSIWSDVKLVRNASAHPTKTTKETEEAKVAKTRLLNPQGPPTPWAMVRTCITAHDFSMLPHSRGTTGAKIEVWFVGEGHPLPTAATPQSTIRIENLKAGTSRGGQWVSGRIKAGRKCAGDSAIDTWHVDCGSLNGYDVALLYRALWESGEKVELVDGRATP